MSKTNIKTLIFQAIEDICIVFDIRNVRRFFHSKEYIKVSRQTRSPRQTRLLCEAAFDAVEMSSNELESKNEISKTSTSVVSLY